MTLDRYSRTLPRPQTTAMARLGPTPGLGDDAPPSTAGDEDLEKGFH